MDGQTRELIRAWQAEPTGENAQAALAAIMRTSEIYISRELHEKIGGLLIEHGANLNQEWWNCNGGKAMHDEIVERQMHHNDLIREWESLAE